MTHLKKGWSVFELFGLTIPCGACEAPVNKGFKRLVRIKDKLLVEYRCKGCYKKRGSKKR